MLFRLDRVQDQGCVMLTKSWQESFDRLLEIAKRDNPSILEMREHALKRTPYRLLSGEKRSDPMIVMELISGEIYEFTRDETQLLLAIIHLDNCNEQDADPDEAWRRMLEELKESS